MCATRARPSTWRTPTPRCRANRGVALATAGPGVTNCVTAMANAHLERVPVLLIGGCPPRAQDDLGPLQGIDHAAILAPVTRQSRTLRVADQIARDLDKAWAMADGDGNPPGPVYVEIPTDVLRETVADAVGAGGAHACQAAAPHAARCRGGFSAPPPCCAPRAGRW